MQLVKVLYYELPTSGKQLPAFPLEVGPGFETPISEVGWDLTISGSLFHSNDPLALTNMGVGPNQAFNKGPFQPSSMTLAVSRDVKKKQH